MSGYSDGMIKSDTKVDLVDAVIAPLYVLSTAISVGLVTQFALSVPWSPADVVTTLGGVEVTWALLIAVGALGTAYATNRPDLNEFSQNETAFLIVGMLVSVGNTLVPLIDTVVSYHPVTQALTIVVGSAAYFMLAYY